MHVQGATFLILDPQGQIVNPFNARQGRVATLAVEHQLLEDGMDHVIDMERQGVRVRGAERVPVHASMCRKLPFRWRDSEKQIGQAVRRRPRV